MIKKKNLKGKSNPIFQILNLTVKEEWLFQIKNSTKQPSEYK